MSRRSVRALLFFAGFYILLGVLLTWQQERFIFFPSGHSFGECPFLTEANTITYNNTRFYSSAPEGAPIAVLYHGNAGSACDRGRYLAPLLREAGYGYLFVEYAGYGGDEVRPSHEGMEQTVRDTVSYIHEHIDVPVTLIGESIGGGVAALHLAHHTPEQLILITPFTTLTDVAQHHYWYYPVSLLLRDPYDVTAAAHTYRNPALVLIAGDDATIPPALSMRVYTALAGEKAVEYVEDATHNTLMMSKEAQAALTTFLTAHKP